MSNYPNAKNHARANELIEELKQTLHSLSAVANEAVGTEDETESDNSLVNVCDKILQLPNIGAFKHAERIRRKWELEDAAAGTEN